jgi:drug/metabolite transporter (DMT)-like permease
MWIVYAVAASIIWGVSYAASGRVIERGMDPLAFFFYYAAFGALVGALALVVTGRPVSLADDLRVLGPDWVWLAVALVSSAAGTLLIYMAIGEKNATLASLIEISYPLFVALFAWLFFRQAHLNPMTVIGAALILSGVAIVFLANRS